MNQQKTHLLLVSTDYDWSFQVQSNLHVGDFEPVGCANCETSAMALFQQRPPDVVLIDAHLTCEIVTELCNEIRQRAPSTRMILITDNQDDDSFLHVKVQITGTISRQLSPSAWPGLLTYMLNKDKYFYSGLLSSLLNPECIAHV